MVQRWGAVRPSRPTNMDLTSLDQSEGVLFTWKALATPMRMGPGGRLLASHVQGRCRARAADPARQAGFAAANQRLQEKKSYLHVCSGLCTFAP